MKGGAVIKIGEVISIQDETDGGRIKVRLQPDDNRRLDEKLPYAYPLLPKLIHLRPKIGEAVLVVLTEADNCDSVRYYIGPIISQPQHMEIDYFGIDSLSLYNGSLKQPDVAPSTNPDSHGAFAKENDVAIYGRKKNDIIFSDDDIKIRCGNRLKDTTVKGGMVFNRTDPAFIHLKHTDNKRGSNNDAYRSTATIVADKINLIGNQSKYPYKTNDKNDLITDSEMQNMIDTAHKLPYGDILIEFLNQFRDAFAKHVHPYPGMSPCETIEFKELMSYPTDKILSDSVRIN